jgi:hypothetical protein
MASSMRGLTQVGNALSIFGHTLTTLLQFIADIRGARVREFEEKRINKEIANIRKKFKGASMHHRT